MNQIVEGGYGLCRHKGMGDKGVSGLLEQSLRVQNGDNKSVVGFLGEGLC